MSYVKTKDMVGPTTGDFQVVTVGAADANITLSTPRVISNPTSTAGVIYFTPSDGSTMVYDYFPAGSWKPISASVIGGTTSGTTVTVVNVWP